MSDQNRSRTFSAGCTGRGRRDRDMRMNLRLAGASPGQALPLALVALAVGTLLVSPFLADVSANLLASRHTDENIADYYSADAGIEWGLWRLKTNLTSPASACPTYSGTPLEPVPSSINGGGFPTTEICSVSNGGAAETITPVWQGGGVKCYDFTSSAAGSVFVVVTSAADVSVALLAGSDNCEKPIGLEPLSGESPYTFEFRGQAAGSYKVLVDTADAGGTLMINYPVASYDLKSTRNGRTITVRATASLSAVRVISWQLGVSP
jgi:hypothetical protein